MMQVRLRALLALALLFGAMPQVQAQAVLRAWLDRASMELGETVTLNVELSGARASGPPDFSALDADFRQLGTSSSTQLSIVNGSSSAQTLWAVGLEPKRAGMLGIPALRLAGVSSAALALQVLPAQSGASAHQGDPVYLEVSAEPLAPYVQQQVRYTVKLFYALNFSDGALEEPQTPGVNVQKLGQDGSYQVTLGERRYNVLERHYALIPERSGALSLPALNFRGHALDADNASGFFGRTRAVSARSDAIELNVRARPAQSGSGPWLPAVALSLSEEGGAEALNARVGEPVTRTLKLSAQGLGYEQLPELNFDAPDGVEVYPDQPTTQTRDDGSWLHGSRERKFAFVPTRPGQLVLPALRIEWWNTATDRAEVAELPARTVEVLAAVASGPAHEAPVAHGVVPESVVSEPVGAVAASTSAPGTDFWRALALGSVLLWLLTLLAWWWRQRGRAPAPAVVAPVRGAGRARTAFRAACQRDDLPSAAQALLLWAREHDPGVRNLGELAARLAPPAQREALIALERTRFGVHADADVQLGARLLAAFPGELAFAAADAPMPAADALPPLYPFKLT